MLLLTGFYLILPTVAMQSNLPATSHIVGASSLYMLAINVESILSTLKKHEFAKWVRKHKPSPDVILFSEHHLKKDDEPKTLLPGYKCVFNSLPNTNKWGVGLAIKNKILFNNINTPMGPLLG